MDDYVSTRPETCLIGSDPGEWFRGGEAVAQFLRGEIINAGGAAQFAAEGTEAGGHVFRFDNNNEDARIAEAWGWCGDQTALDAFFTQPGDTPAPRP